MKCIEEMLKKWNNLKNAIKEMCSLSLFFWLLYLIYLIWDIIKNWDDLKTILIWHQLLTDRKQTIMKNSIRCCTIEFPAESKMREISVCARVNDTKQIVQLSTFTNKHAKTSFSSQIYVAKISSYVYVMTYGASSERAF